jgi:hypothetical protein
MTARSGSSRWTGDIQLGTELIIDNDGWTGNLVLDGRVSTPSVSTLWNGTVRNTLRGVVAAGNGIYAVGLDGTGTVTYPSGDLAHRVRPGTALNTGILSISGDGLGRHATRINGLAAGTSYDRLVVTGLLDLTNARLAVTVDSVSTSAWRSVHDRGEIRDGPSHRPLPIASQGGILLANGHVFAIDYRGGDGNDIVLNTL